MYVTIFSSKFFSASKPCSAPYKSRFPMTLDSNCNKSIELYLFCMDCKPSRQTSSSHCRPLNTQIRHLNLSYFRCLQNRHTFFFHCPANCNFIFRVNFNNPGLYSEFQILHYCNQICCLMHQQLLFYMYMLFLQQDFCL